MAKWTKTNNPWTKGAVAKASAKKAAKGKAKSKAKGK